MVSLAVLNVLQDHTLQHELQLLVGDGHAGSATRTHRQFIGALFESFVVKSKAVTFPAQQLDVGAAAVQEDENRTTEHWLVHMGRDEAGKAVEALSHISRRMVEIITYGGREVDHGCYARRALRYCALTGS